MIGNSVTRFSVCVVIIIWSVLIGTLPAQETPISPSPTPVELIVPEEVLESTGVTDWSRGLDGKSLSTLSKAEILSVLELAIESDQEELRVLTEEIGENGAYAVAEGAFEDISSKVQALEAELDAARQAGDAPAASRLESELAPLQKLREIERERFDIFIDRRRFISRLQPVLATLIADTEFRRDISLGDHISRLPSVPTEPPQQPPPAEQPEVSVMPGGPLPDTTTAASPVPTATPQRKSEVPAIRRAREALEDARNLVVGSDARIRWLEERIRVNEEAFLLEEQLAETARRLVASAGKLQAFYEAQAQLDSAKAGIDVDAGLRRTKAFQAEADSLLTLSKTRLEELTARHEISEDGVEARSADLEGC